MKIPILLALFVLSAGFQSRGSLGDAIMLYEQGKFSHAASLLQQLKNSAPSDPELRIWLGKSYIKTRDWDKAVQEMEKAVQIKSDSAQYHLWLGRACGARASHSIFITAMSWARRVVKEFETARKLAPDDLDVRFDLLDYYLNAPALLGGGKEKAEAEAKAIAQRDPQKGYAARAMIHSKNKKWDLARKEFTQAVLDNSHSVSANKDLAEFLLDRREYEGALDYAQKALAVEGTSKRARLIAAAARIRLNSDLEEAGATILDLSTGTLGDGDPAFEEVYAWLGEYHLAKEDKAKAREAFKSALAFDPDYGKAKDGLSKSK